jgi:hypothetical protein
VENNQVLIAKIKKSDGKIYIADFPVGTGGSGRYSSELDFLPEHNAIVFSGYEAYGTPSDWCKSEVFKWNKNTNMFEYDQSLSQEFSAKKCKELCDYPPFDESFFEYICK